MIEEITVPDQDCSPCGTLSSGTSSLLINLNLAKKLAINNGLHHGAAHLSQR
ncbi:MULTISPECIES: hypothetical protein [unclassified Janthinobacterium]|uniref:hypothetical protein n=1 Tax=unclassified Janthinobacterium TaxID=2610881 RepID=UPI0015870CAD|nr:MULTISPECIES: hypothetical protein [unclassified Janthinobacterium]